MLLWQNTMQKVSRNSTTPFSTSGSCTVETTPPTMQARQMTDRPGMQPCTLRKTSLCPSHRFRRNPTAMGMMVTMRIWRNIPRASTSTRSPASRSTSSGVSTGASSVEAQVIPTE